MFALSSEVDGIMTREDYGTLQLDNGTNRADILCQEEAERAGLWGHYSALLSTKQYQLQNITAEQYRHLPIVNSMVSELVVCGEYIVYNTTIDTMKKHVSK